MFGVNLAYLSESAWDFESMEVPPERFHTIKPQK